MRRLSVSICAASTLDKEVEKPASNVAAATKVGELIGEIAAASNEQAQGIQQINQAVSQMDQVTQQNVPALQSLPR